MNLIDVAHELAERLISTFELDATGQRPVFGGTKKFQTDPALARQSPVQRVFPRRQWSGCRG
jgi:hypothetical protein